MSITTAAPITHRDQEVPVCQHCHEGIKRVPGGHGPIWVHDDGYRVCKCSPPCVGCDILRGVEVWPEDEDQDVNDDLGHELRHDK